MMDHQVVAAPALVPEFDVADLTDSLLVYRDVFGFSLLFDRPEEAFAYVARGGAHLMLQEASGPGRRFRTAPLERPCGRGMNLQVRIDNVERQHDSARAAGLVIVVELEERWYRQGAVERGNRQFVVADPDGYLLRFYEDLGFREPEREASGGDGVSTAGSASPGTGHPPAGRNRRELRVPKLGRAAA